MKVNKEKRKKNKIIKKKINKKKTDKKKNGRRNIRKIIKNCDLNLLTIIAAKNEKERKQRLKEKEEECSELLSTTESEELMLDYVPLISVDKNLVKLLKPHQKRGIKFMWDACFESCEGLSGSTGGGCILAHCMGLGKQNILFFF